MLKHVAIIFCCFTTATCQPCQVESAMEDITLASGILNTVGQFKQSDHCHWYFRRNSYENVAFKITFHYLEIYYDELCDYASSGFMVLPDYSMRCTSEPDITPRCYIFISRNNEEKCDNIISTNTNCVRLVPSTDKPLGTDFGEYLYPNRNPPYVISYTAKMSGAQYGFNLTYEWIDCTNNDKAATSELMTSNVTGSTTTYSNNAKAATSELMTSNVTGSTTTHSIPDYNIMTSNGTELTPDFTSLMTSFASTDRKTDANSPQAVAKFSERELLIVVSSLAIVIITCLVFAVIYLYKRLQQTRLSNGPEHPLAPVHFDQPPPDPPMMKKTASTYHNYETIEPKEGYTNVQYEIPKPFKDHPKSVDLYEI